MTRRERPALPVVAAAGVAVAFFAVPVFALLWRAPWGSLADSLRSEGALEALRLSLVTSVAATALAFAFGVPLAWVQARFAYPGRRFVRALVTLPMVMPPVVGGIALLVAVVVPGLVVLVAAQLVQVSAVADGVAAQAQQRQDCGNG